MLSSTLLQIFLAGAVSAVPIIEKRDTACSPIHIIAARGSTEAPGPGAIGSLATLIQAANPGTDLESIAYPALLEPYDYSSSAGTAAVTSQLTAYVKRCPSSKVVLLGYSQGAHILLDSLCGGGDYPGLGPATPPISTTIGDHVTAIVQYGDPRFRFGQSYDVGTDKSTNGIFPRKLTTQSCAHYASKIQSWCDAGDPFCASGFNLAAHLDYDQKYDQAALAFVNQMLAS